MLKGWRERVLVVTALLASLTGACGANEQILKSGKRSPTPSNPESPPSTVDQEIEMMRTANFRYIWVIRRKDGGELDAGDKSIIRPNTADMNRRVVTDDQRAVIIGSNAVPFRDNFDALSAAFAVQDISPEPVPSPLPTREPTPKTARAKQ